MTWWTSLLNTREIFRYFSRLLGARPSMLPATRTSRARDHRMPASNFWWRHMSRFPSSSLLAAAEEWRYIKMLRNFAGGLFYVLALYCCATFGSIFLMGPSLPLLWLRPRWFRWINDRLIMLWLVLPPVSFWDWTESEFSNTLQGIFRFQTGVDFIVFHENRFGDWFVW